LKKELDANYKAAIAKGDAAFKSDKFDDAKAGYNEALGLKPKEKYPTDQLAAIDKNTSLSPGERAAQRAMAFLGALNNGLQSIGTAHQMLGEHVQVTASSGVGT